jgi:hypothetical protein
MHNNGYDIQANLLLFENIQTGQRSQIPNGSKNYILNTSDIDIIKDLMSTAIPVLKTNGLNYTVKMDGKIYKI